MKEEKFFPDEEILAIKNILKDCLKSYAAKDAAVSNKQWLKDLFLEKIKTITEEKAAEDAGTIVRTVNAFTESFGAMHQAEQQGISNESWLAKAIQEDIEKGQFAENAEEAAQFEDILYLKNTEMAGETPEYLQSDGVEQEEADGKEYSEQQMKDIAVNIGKNARAYGIQSAASTAGTMLVAKLLEKEDIAPNQIIQEALKSGMDTSLQIAASGALKIASANQLVQCLPDTTPAGVIANLSSAGIEGVKILQRVVSGELSISKGIEQFGRLGIALVKNVWNSAAKTSLKEAVKNYLPFMGTKSAAISETVGTICAFLGGSDFGKKIAEMKTRVANSAKVVAKTAMQGIRKAKEYVKTGVQKAKKLLNMLLC